MEEYISLIATSLAIPAHKIKSTIALLEDGATIPFISRYRKEATGSLDEIQIGDIQTQLSKLKEIDKRRESILNSIEEQGKLTDELRKRIESTYNLTELEDLYLPYKRKKKTRASVAKEQGLEPLATAIYLQQNQNPQTLAAKFITEHVPDTEAALQGARNIIAEWINENEEARNSVRFSFEKGAILKSKVARGKKEEGAKYRDYFEFEEPLKKCPSHRLLAIRRGEDEGFFKSQYFS